MNSQIINSVSDSMNTTVYFFLKEMHLYPQIALLASLQSERDTQIVSDFYKKTIGIIDKFIGSSCHPF